MVPTAALSSLRSTRSRGEHLLCRWKWCCCQCASRQIEGTGNICSGRIQTNTTVPIQPPSNQSHQVLVRTPHIGRWPSPSRYRKRLDPNQLIAFELRPSSASTARRVATSSRCVGGLFCCYAHYQTPFYCSACAFDRLLIGTIPSRRGLALAPLLARYAQAAPYSDRT